MGVVSYTSIQGFRISLTDTSHVDCIAALILCGVSRRGRDVEVDERKVRARYGRAACDIDH